MKKKFIAWLLMTPMLIIGVGCVCYMLAAVSVEYFKLAGIMLGLFVFQWAFFKGLLILHPLDEQQKVLDKPPQL